MQQYSIQNICIDIVCMQASIFLFASTSCFICCQAVSCPYCVHKLVPLTCGCLIFACGVSGCLRLQANRLSHECCDLSLQSAGVSHNVALHHAPLQGGCHIGGDKSANMASLGLEIALCAASKPAYKCSRNELKMLHSCNKWLISAFHCLLRASPVNVMLAASHASASEVVM